MWVLAPLLRHVCDVSREVSHELQVRQGACVPPLALTVHAGESYIHLWSGMRSVGEALHHLPLLEHDRLGHALALGEDPMAWSRARGTVAMPREDRLMDLVWARDRLVACGAQVDGYRIEDELRAHARAMFGAEVRVDDLRAAVARLYDPACLRRLAWHSGALGLGKPRDPVDTLVLQYLTDVGTFERGQEVVLVHTAPDVPMMCAAQELLRSEVRARGVTVEVNPSSNLFVGDLGDLTRHPVFQLSPMRADAPRVAVTLGSDDLTIFNAPLRVEWQLLKDAAALHPDVLKDVDQWLERIRVHGLRCGFALAEVRPLVAGAAMPSRVDLPP